MKYVVKEGDGAFYGPKIDFHVKDSQGRTWQLSTIQLDMALPERFDLEYADEKGNKSRPIMLHRVIYGAIERFLGILLEHTNGALPIWLSPIQVKVLSFTDRNVEAAQKVLDELRAKGIRAVSSFDSATMGVKVRDAEMMKVPYIVTIGDKEEKSGEISVKQRGQKALENFKVKDFVEKVVREIEKRV
jgi:threonyl-tRNA synthetase